MADPLDLDALEKMGKSVRGAWYSRDILALVARVRKLEGLNNKLFGTARKRWDQQNDIEDGPEWIA